MAWRCRWARSEFVELGVAEAPRSDRQALRSREARVKSRCDMAAIALISIISMYIFIVARSPGHTNSMDIGLALQWLKKGNRASRT
jgi:hypothetical protein